MTWLDAVYNLLLCIGRPARYGDIAGLTRRLLANASGITTQTIPAMRPGGGAQRCIRWTPCSGRRSRCNRSFAPAECDDAYASPAVDPTPPSRYPYLRVKVRIKPWTSQPV
jgi:hypothetical protein